MLGSLLRYFGSPPSGVLTASTRAIGCFVGLLGLVLPPLLLIPNHLDASAAWTLGVTLLVASWWMTEVLPISITSLIPLGFFPMLGILDEDDIVQAYGHPLVLLLLGALILSKSMERSNTHRQIALFIIRRTGGSDQKRLILSFMIATAFISMWIGNTPTAAMMLPVALAFASEADNPRFGTLLLLGLAYACSIGGMGTPIGTLPNIIFRGIYEQNTGEDFSFMRWMSIGVPMVMVLIPLTWLLLTRSLKSGKPVQLPDQGPLNSEQKRVLLVFGITGVLWFTRTFWAQYTGWLGDGVANDNTVVIFGVLLLFLIPSARGSSRRLLDWEAARTVPWGVLLLVGGGLSLAQALQSSGLTQIIGGSLSSMTHLPLFVMVLVLCLSVTFLTEITSNTAVATIFLPIIAAVGASANLADPASLMIPVALSASCAFMLPVATMPNAIVMSSEKIPVRTMAKEGFLLNLTAALVIATASTLIFN